MTACCGIDDRVRSALWASRVGQVIGWFIAGSATAEAQQAVVTGLLRSIRVSQVMTPDPPTAARWNASAGTSPDLPGNWRNRGQ